MTDHTPATETPTADTPTADTNDVRPRVARVSRDRGPWLFAAVTLVAAIALFLSLESRRETRSGDLTDIDDGSADARRIIAAPADLAIPAPPIEYPPQVTILPPRPVIYAIPRRSASASPAPTQPRAPVPQYIDPVISMPQPSRRYQEPEAPPLRREGDETPAPAAATRGGGRVTASRLANPSTTVPKGTVMQAVLETALDSTRPGFARAVISRDVFGFDGSQVLVPRGSRLIGEYKADLQAGQKRALIQWTRLLRPDGVMIALDSPAADPLGRAGVEGKVNSHFLARFGGAILQSVLNLGTQVAVARATRNSSVVLAVPLGQQQAVPNITPDRVQPSMTVRQGTSVSVFVALDLDFTNIDL